MRDGAKLATDLVKPDGPGPWPALLARTPYGRRGVDSSRFVGGRYAVVVQDMRGTGDSGGKRLTFFSDGWGSLQDGFDTVKWIANQPWSNGRIGTFGGSALGINQALLAGSLPPDLVCQHVSAATYDLFSSVYSGGALKRGMLESWIGRHGTDEMLDLVVSHREKDEIWSALDASHRFARIPYPTMHIGGWFDPFCQDTIDAFHGLQYSGAPGARGNQRLVIGPWIHGGISELRQGDLLFPPNSKYDFEGEMVAWFDHWLLGEDSRPKGPVVRYYTMGDMEDEESRSNIWRASDVWPIPSSPLRFYLHPGGSLGMHIPTCIKSSETYLYDPNDPVPTMGGANLARLGAGPLDQRKVESRDDVIVYDSHVLDEGLEVTGRVWVDLYISSSVSTTDFTAKLTDVYPDGRSILLLDGIVRLSAIGGKPRQVRIDLGSISILFGRGHRIRLAISSSNHPRFDVNPNTDEILMEQGEGVIARNTVHQDKTRPSALVMDGVP